jgi:hypothetical protein
MTYGYALGGLALLAVVLAPARAEDRKLTRAEQEAKARAEDNAQVVVQLGLAHDLAEQGRRMKSPLALVAAAQLLRTIKTLPLPVKDRAKVEYEPGATPAKEEEAEAPLSPAEEAELLLQDARVLADRQAKAHALTQQEHAAIETLIKQVKNAAQTRGARGGPQQRTGWLGPGQTHAWAIDFNGLTPEYVRVFGNGRTLLRLTVRNNRDVLKGEETAYNPGGTWYSGPGGGVFTVRVTNVGNVGTSYRMISN